LPQLERLQIRVFVCHNALAQELRSQRLEELALPEHVQVEEVPCLGRIDARYLLRTFEQGCDAVCLFGCPGGKCRTMDGNLRARKRVAFVKGILEEIGISGERLSVFLQPPMDEDTAKDVLADFLSGIHPLGPSELRTSTNAETE
jgi:F420-non-reducing hydrogenase iron-sulfur subunit